MTPVSTQGAHARPGADEPLVHRRSGRAAPWPVQFYGSAVGKKWVMALSGLAMIGFLVGHLVGNLKVYLGAEDLNAYADALRTLLHPIMPNEVVLWIMRIGLIVALIAHVHAAASLTAMNRASRPVGYKSPRDYVAANFASRSMRWTGLIVFAYLVFHILDLTLGKTGYDYVHGDVYHNFVESMSRPLVALVYVIANLAVALHLYHGAWSMFQSMGLNNPRYNVARRVVAGGIATLIGLGNVLFPIMVQAGVIS